MEIGRVIDRHYLVQRLVKQGQVSTVYQGYDQKLQRVIALKAVPSGHAPSYREAARMTAQFSHMNIVTLYDLIPQPEALYLVQEYIEGHDFAELAQMQLTPYEVVDFGRQICLALLYAGAASRRTGHGDLTPAAVLRDHFGIVRVNNFALPGNLDYFTAWSILGGDGVPLLERGLPPGVDSEERRADDVRAVGLLLYQLLVGRLQPPPGAQLRFPSSVPGDVCEIVARALLRQHPQNIQNASTLYDDLNALAELIEPAAAAPSSEPAYLSSPPYQQAPIAAQMSPAGMSVPNSLVLPGSQSQSGRGLAAYASAAPNARMESATALEPNAAPTMANSVFRATHPPVQDPVPGYPNSQAAPSARGSSLWLLLLLGLVFFALFFIIGYFAGNIFVR